MNKMNKSEVYSWRLTPALKTELERAARADGTSLATILERLTRDWLKQRKNNDEVEQERMRAALMACAGTYKGDGTSATNANVRKVMGEYLEAKYGRRRPD